MKLLKILLLFIFVMVCTYSYVTAIDMYLNSNDLSQSNNLENNTGVNETVEEQTLSAPTTTRNCYRFFSY